MHAEAMDILTNSPPPPDGQPKGEGSGDPVLQKVFRRLELQEQAEAIDSALRIIPKEYRSGVWNNIQWRTSFPDNAHRVTYSRYKSKYIYEVAMRLGLIEKK